MTGARAWQAALGCALAVGCATHGGVTTAHPVGQGNVQVGIEPGAAMVSGVDRPAVAPTFNVAVRYGVSDRVDLGGRLGTTGYELLGKIQLNQPGADVPISVAPSGHVVAWGRNDHGFAYVQYQVPLLVGIPLGESQLVVGPKVRHMIAVGGAGGHSSGGSVLMTGGVVALSLKAGNTFRFHPEVALDVPTIGTGLGEIGGGGGVAVGGGIGAALIGFNLGLLFGGD